MATMPPPRTAPSEPVQVDERIPVAGEHDVSPKEARDEGIPLPANLRLQRGDRARGRRPHPPRDRPEPPPARGAEAAGEGARVRSSSTATGFIAEAQMTGQLEHPNIVPVHELGVSPEGVPYFTMKLVHGRGLRRLAPRSPDGHGRARPAGPRDLPQGLRRHRLRARSGRDPPRPEARQRDGGRVRAGLRHGLGPRAPLQGPARAPDSVPRRWRRGARSAPRPTCPRSRRAGDPDEMDERTDVFGLGAILYQNRQRPGAVREAPRPAARSSPAPSPARPSPSTTP